ncbi:MAG: NADH:ubiquinone reductase (Na(+)-transporting) subunit C [Bacteroidetes bacterium HGW-Bacteroidetes-21]|jgi:Na+-transporting NADH:ubiquinone oxidoreductase subunit C|nr:MAG: NADH:ubiquinone reductase (Na(+)-transporting) subunit C [Bacteroidetes bacterium HGW-Bacteroidetes-21]
MNTNKNSYIFIYATVMIVIVAVMLSLASLLLKPKQDFNIDVEKKKNILSSINITAEAKEVPDLYKKHITAVYAVDANGKVMDGVDALNIKLKDELVKAPENRSYPVFEAINKEGEKLYIFPIQGKGLWGPIWGYVSFKEDLNTVYGAVFDHKGETPGLGAEIAQPDFQARFKDKTIFDETGNYTSIKITKPGTTAPTIHNVDGISGGTITSNGLGLMLKTGLENYIPFITTKKDSL